jgi:hypothetical protein
MTGGSATNGVTLTYEERERVTNLASTSGRFYTLPPRLRVLRSWPEVSMSSAPHTTSVLGWAIACARSTRVLQVVLIVALLLPGVGCVRRRLNVRTNPPGALVYVDNQQIGTTPCSVDFVYYGTREIRLVKPGFETLTVNQPIPTPWYEYPPLDFISENLVASKIRDNRTVTYNLAPQVIVPTQELVDRANQLRQETLQFPVTQAGAAIPVGSPPVIVPAPTPAPGIAPPSTMPQRLPGVTPMSAVELNVQPGNAEELLPPPPSR